MDPVLKDIADFDDWPAAVNFLGRAEHHFVKTSKYPPENLCPANERILVLGKNRRVGFTHLPVGTDNDNIHWMCHLLMGHRRETHVHIDLVDFLRDMAEHLKGKFDLGEVACAITTRTSKLFDADGSAILVVNDTKDGLRFVAVHSRLEEVSEKLSQLEIPIGSGLAGWVAEKREAVISHDVRNDPRFNWRVDQETKYQTTDMIAAPVTIGDELLGVIQVINSQNREFHEQDLPTISIVSTVVAIILEKAQLRNKHQDYERATGKAEVANSVLHNIGNVLNSVNVSCSLMDAKIQRSKLGQFLMANQLIEQNLNDLANFFETSRGKLLPEFLKKVGEHFQHEQDAMAEEIRKITGSTNLMRDIIETQQTIAKVGASDAQDLIQLVEEALVVVQDLLRREKVTVEKDFTTGKPIKVQKAKLIHILINLMKNAVEAMESVESAKRTLKIGTYEEDTGMICLTVRDSGMGIAPEALARMFTHGFTTKANGHGFGLHSCAKAMEEMNGSIRVDSEGVGLGAVFILSLPAVPKTIY